MSNQSKADAYKSCRRVDYSTHLCVSKYPKVGFPTVCMKLGVHQLMGVHQRVDSQGARSGAEGNVAASAYHPEHPTSLEHCRVAQHKHQLFGINSSNFTLHNIGIP